MEKKFTVKGLAVETKDGLLVEGVLLNIAYLKNYAGGMLESKYVGKIVEATGYVGEAECRIVNEKGLPIQSSEGPGPSVIQVESIKLLETEADLIKNAITNLKGNYSYYAARNLRELAENTVDISSAVQALLKFLDKEEAEDILYDYVYRSVEEMVNYAKHLDMYEAYLALKHFKEAKKENATFLMQEIEKVALDKNLLWVKELSK